jgi:hypothetical protein
LQFYPNIQFYLIFCYGYYKFSSIDLSACFFTTSLIQNLEIYERNNFMVTWVADYSDYFALYFSGDLKKLFLNF